MYISAGAENSKILKLRKNFETVYLHEILNPLLLRKFRAEISKNSYIRIPQTSRSTWFEDFLGHELRFSG